MITEHLREPTSLLWSALAPCLLFIITTPKHTTLTYTASTAWFYSYISASVAFFGFSFYLIGRRESGFTRSFIYQRGAIKIFLISHTLSYLVLSTLYALLFYLLTKPLRGHYLLPELLYLLACFYTSYLMFTCIGLGIAALPIKFSTASTLFFAHVLSHAGLWVHSYPTGLRHVSPANADQPALSECSGIPWRIFTSQQFLDGSFSLCGLHIPDRTTF